MRKPNGCWWFSGCLVTTVSSLLIILFVWMTFEAEKKMDENRAEYAASTQEYEDAMKAYEADSANLNRQYQRVMAEIEAATKRNDSMMVAALQDSLSCYAEPEWNPRGAIGFSGGFFFVFLAMVMLIPLAIGLLLLLYYYYRKRKWRKSNLWSLPD